MENYILPIGVVCLLIGVAALLYFNNENKDWQTYSSILEGKVNTCKAEIKLTKTLLKYKEEELNSAYNDKHNLIADKEQLELKLKHYTSKCESLQISNVKLQNMNSNLNNTIIQLNEVIKKKDNKIDSLKNKL